MLSFKRTLIILRFYWRASFFLRYLIIPLKHGMAMFKH